MWNETAIARELDGKFYLIDGTDRNALSRQRAQDAQLRAIKNDVARAKLREKFADIASFHEQATAPTGTLDAANIVRAVAKAHDVSVRDIKGGARFREVIAARHHACSLMRELLGMSYPAIAAAVGLRDHSTSIHACTTWAKRGHVFDREDAKARKLLSNQPNSATMADSGGAAELRQS